MLWQKWARDAALNPTVQLLFGGADDDYWGVLSVYTRDVRADLADRPGDWVKIQTDATRYYVGRFTDSGMPAKLLPISDAGDQSFFSVLPKRLMASF